jgi:hypothetical protein
MFLVFEHRKHSGANLSQVAVTMFSFCEKALMAVRLSFCRVAVKALSRHDEALSVFVFLDKHIGMFVF